MKRRIFLSIFFTSMFILGITFSVVMMAIYKEFSNEQKLEIRNETEYMSITYEQSGTVALKKINTKTSIRISLISPDGTVLYDNFADANTLENHLDRPEVSEAIENGKGESVRKSNTLGEKTYYYALRLDDGNILRTAATIKSISKIMHNTIIYLIIIFAFSIILVVITARMLTKRIVTPINNIQLENPVESNIYDELSPLAAKMDKQNKTILSQINELAVKQNEFSEITDCMSEGLVIYSTHKKVITSNKSAKQIFSCRNSDNYISYLKLCRDTVYIKAIESAFSGTSAEGKLKKNGRIYHLSATPVKSHGNYAAVMFLVDITAAEQSEQVRREFTANVSHELKTPLTSIMGYAEIMSNGIAKPEDFPRFTKQIYDEAKRLLTLINDIIKLSKLDEDALKEQFVNVSLYKLAENVVNELHTKAENNNISLSLSGDDLSVSGIENTLHEMIYNLCDNAISYNISGGSVNISIKKENNKTILCVKDTGIGIAPEHQNRVFERFYRVDVSHSNIIGGTGLGLSIVKHGAILHGAEIRLKSIFGNGSEISLVF